MGVCLFPSRHPSHRLGPEARDIRKPFEGQGVPGTVSGMQGTLVLFFLHFKLPVEGGGLPDLVFPEYEGTWNTGPADILKDTGTVSRWTEVWLHWRLRRAVAGGGP